MRRRFLAHLTYANVVATLALVIAVSGGTAYAVNTIFSSDIVDGEVKNRDLATNSVQTGKVANENLTGADIANQSGVDTCTHGAVRYGELCVGIANLHQAWDSAVQNCAGLELRLPSFGEARSLAWNHDLPAVDANEYFWTEEFTDKGLDGVQDALVVSGVGNWKIIPYDTPSETVCVTTPTN